ncbi:endonuclease/exonuclease/phosphatase family protein [Falsirhodobacter sp. 20TX0035]|uniref:endonuclease/exonuclease/phosphatase family protein n=1 Tax=Falsirhodobacter sp. 20TX0035 TaxID=3022019 RepID=UPI00232CFF83|nr:endonuclease/exonuclease/phosphatase family protein [Falsirhodobacter sp. 20TX0035]MDB6453992.1 endonuclease/exonuclease/phosphatase family protein [Falsirhodobacter sp. 20TX0035]
MRAGLFLVLLLTPLAAMADPVRVATFHTDLSAKGPGLMLRDILRGDAAGAVAAVDATRADILVLQDVDYDLHGVGLSAFADLLATDYPFRLALRPNTGMGTGLDLDGDGRLGGAADAQGFGFFSGDGGMAVLSRFPILADQMRDFSAMLWADLPDALLFEGMGEEARAVQRLSSVGHWEVPVQLPSGAVLRLLTFHATTPVFDGPEDRNGRRNADEIAFWPALIDGRLPFAPTQGPWVLLGSANADPQAGDGRRDAIAALLAHPALTDPLPGTVTAEYPQTGPLRLDYVLPQAGIAVTGTGVGEGVPHRPVWVDLDL